MQDFKHVKKINDNQFIVNADLDVYGSGYGVVPKEEDPCNKYDIEEVREYVTTHPEMLFEHYNNEPDFLNDEMNAYKSELAELECWFVDVYDVQVKQYERCMRLGIDYDNKYGTMQELDDMAVKKSKRISELRKLLKEK